jgi:hypothetical protein
MKITHKIVFSLLSFFVTTLVFSQNQGIEKNGLITANATDCIPITGTIKIIKKISYPFQFSSEGKNSSELACTETDFPLKFYAASPSLGINSELFLNEGLSQPVANGDLWYQLSINRISYRIDNSGKVAEIKTCSTSTAPLTTFYYQGQWHSSDTIHKPEINCWVTYLDENNIQQKFIVGPVDNGCQSIQAVSIITENNVHECTP